MEPSELSNLLRRMASKIDNSKSPSKTKVSRDLKKILSMVASDSGLSKAMGEAVNQIKSGKTEVNVGHGLSARPDYLITLNLDDNESTLRMFRQSGNNSPELLYEAPLGEFNIKTAVDAVESDTK